MSPESLLTTLRAYKPHRLVVVFGCGGNRSKLRRYGMGEICAKMADFSILTEDNNRFEKVEDILTDIAWACLLALCQGAEGEINLLLQGPRP